MRASIAPLIHQLSPFSLFAFSPYPYMEPTTGIEPVNLFLTKEVLYLLSYVGPGAGNGTRTRNPQLGRLTLWPIELFPRHWGKLVERGGFEPPKAAPTDLQSAPFGHSGTSPAGNASIFFAWSWRWESNPQPADYKSAALPLSYASFGSPGHRPWVTKF